MPSSWSQNLFTAKRCVHNDNGRDTSHSYRAVIFERAVPLRLRGPDNAVSAVPSSTPHLGGRSSNETDFGSVIGSGVSRAKAEDEVSQNRHDAGYVGVRGMRAGSLCISVHVTAGQKKARG